MRLLNVKSLEFAEFSDKIPPYAIASHRWQEEEVTFQEVNKQRNTNKRGYEKVRNFAKYIQDSIHAVEWVWIDTCCINKDSAAELSEAINLMFKWYRNAEVCLAYLADVDETGDEQSLWKSEWFERGWTLQELLAPPTVVFVTKTWQVLGNKGASSNNYCGSPAGPGLEREIAARTGIPERILHDYNASHGLSVNERLKWMKGRKTSRTEDMFYALYGIFSITPGANYGEGYEGARRRLHTAISYEEDLTAQQVARFRKISTWLEAPNPWTNHDSARQRHESQTGTWLLDCDEYRNWKLASLQHLWIYGKPGCGKTVLCSTAIEDVKRHCESASNSGYAVFYLSFSDNEKQRYEDVLLSWVVQLGWREPALSMLQQAYEKPNRDKPGQDELERILLSSVETYDEVFLLIDALDECPEDGDVRHYMMECLARLGHIAQQLKILVTSRELPDIRDSMVTLGAQPVSIQTHSVDADIRRYTATQLSRDHRLSRLDRATKALIEETISAKADGMFRWADCQLQELKKLKSTRPRCIKEALYSLPATLDDTYERMLVSIEDGLHTDALTLLRWLAYAKSPPSLSELVDAVVIDLTADGKVEWEDRPGLDDTLEILSGLVTIVGHEKSRHNPDYVNYAERHDPESESGEIEYAQSLQISEDTKVRLAHFSVKEYLESKRILHSGAKDFYLESTKEHRVLSQSCLIYLMHYSSCDEKLSTEQDLATFPLLEYAAKSWFYHSALQTDAPIIREAGLLRTEAALKDWLQVYQPDREWQGRFDELYDTGSGLYYASFLGLEQVVAELISTEANVNAWGGYYGNALQAASFQGHERVVQMLMDAGAEVNAQGGTFGNALQAASSGGHERVVQMLMDAGAEVNAQGGLYGNALQAASFQGHERVVQMLMDAGADFDGHGEKDDSCASTM